jgi:hypothetical protein
MLKKIIFTLFLLITSSLLFNISYLYIGFDKHVDFLQTKQFIYEINSWRFSFYIHVFTGILIYISGGLQFLISHQKRPNLHRFLGYLYVGFIFITFPAVLIMSFRANGGYVAQIGFVIQSLLWLLCTWFGLRAILKNKPTTHKRFMIRSYALTLGAFTLRFLAFLIGMMRVDLHPNVKYTFIAWGSWIINLLIAEWIIKKMNFSSQLTH